MGSCWLFLPQSPSSKPPQLPWNRSFKMTKSKAESKLKRVLVPPHLCTASGFCSQEAEEEKLSLGHPQANWTGSCLWSGVPAPSAAAASDSESCLLLTQEAFCAVSILLREAAGGMEDVGEGNH